MYTREAKGFEAKISPNIPIFHLKAPSKTPPRSRRFQHNPLLSHGKLQCADYKNVKHFKPNEHKTTLCSRFELNLGGTFVTTKHFQIFTGRNIGPYILTAT